MGIRITRTGTFRLGCPAARAMPLFTAEGERAWAAGWEPHYATDPSPDEPGQVWSTHAHGHDTTWITVARTDRSATYARVTPHDSAGTVSVALTDTELGCEVTVTYDLSSLSDAGSHRLEHFAEGYDAMLLEWQRLTSAHL